MLNTKLRRTSLVILAVVLMLSVFAMTAFAEENTLLISPNPNANEAVSADTPDDEGALEVDGIEDGSETEAAADEKSDAVTDEKSDSATTGEAEVDEHAGHNHGDEEETKDEGFTTSDLVLLIIFIVVVIAVVIFCIIKREKVGKFFRGLKSEFKKIVWSPWNQVRKNTIVVIVVVVALAAVIGLLDFLFGQGITELKNLINP